ncbi:MAG: PqqD family protein [Deltaproteobacteria bacterium]|nr:PqqD family protein [Deltaproteobacteria bacterium]
MKVFRKKRNHIRGDRGVQADRGAAFKFIPVKNSLVTEEKLESGEILIHYPVTMRPWIAGLVKRFSGSQAELQNKPLQLDQLGTEVWGLIDGNRSVRRIIEIFAETHQLQIREAEVAVSQFIRMLGQRGVIGLR